VLRSAKADQAVESRLSVRNAPVCHRTGLPTGVCWKRLDRGPIRSHSR
jgi:hypothetical protein